MKKSYFLTSLQILSTIGVLMLLFGCNKVNKKNTTYFGGKIKNPKEKFVYFLQGEKVIDSAELNTQNNFSFQFNDIKSNLYTFKHGPEYQYLYIEPKDSLLIYLNTWDFDESLVFSGKGSAKNNFLINLYLRQESNENKIKYYYQLNEEEFSNIINEGIQENLTKYNVFLENQDKAPSKLFDKVIKTGIYFPNYYYKEYYPFKHKWLLKLKEYPKLSPDFYAYRKNIHFNDSTLVNYAPYRIYIKTYLYNLAYTEKIKNPEKKNLEKTFMDLVNEKIHLKKFKNELLAESMWKSLSNSNLPIDEFNKLHECFVKNCTDEKIKTKLQNSINQKQKLNKGDTLPTIIVSNIEGRKTTINTLTANNKSVVYFWPKNLRAREYLNKKRAVLEKKYPNIRFIGIETNVNNDDWIHTVTTENLNNQYFLSKTTQNYDWFNGEMARTIIINNDGNVINSYLFFNDKHFEKHLAPFKND